MKELNFRLVLFDSINPSFAETLSYLPDNDYFLETDSDHRVDIVGYRLMAELRKIDIFALRKQMYQNCCNFSMETMAPAWLERTSLLVGG